MTLPEPSAPRKASRTGLYAPIVILALIVVGWSAAWFWLAGEVGRRLDRASPPGASYVVGWRDRTVSGYPFRLDVDFDDLRVGERSGWALAVPRLETEASIFAPGHWVAVAPSGASFTRPAAGEVDIKARLLRLSLSETAKNPPRLSIEGGDLTFSTPSGAKPFSITFARELHIHTRAGPGDKGAVFFDLVDAQARSTGLVGRVADGRPLNVIIDLTYTHAASLAGRGWSSAVSAWNAAGGALAVRDLKIGASGAVLEARSGALGVDNHGALSGALVASLTSSASAPRGLGQATPNGSRRGAFAVTVDFKGGKTRLDNVVIGPAPRLY